MKIISMHISGFGKLSGDYKFDTLTTICEKNGWGKTTLAAFIKAMFYGLAPTKSNSIKYDDRRRYFPFECNKFGGSLTYEKDEVTFTVERYFDEKSGKGDTLRLYRGIEEIAPPESLGQEVFGVDEKTFMRTIFIGGEEIENLADIGASLSSVVDDTDNANFDRAIKKLDDELTALKAKRGKGGRMNILSSEIVDLELRREHLEGIAKTLNERRAGLEQLKAERDGLQLSFKAASEDELWDIYDGLMHDIEVVNEKIDLIMSKYPEGIPQGEALGKLEKLCVDYRETKSKIDRLKSNTNSGKRAYYFMIFAYIVAAGCLIGGAVFALYRSMTPAIVLWSVCVVAIVIARAIPMSKKSGLNRLIEEEKRLRHYGELLLGGFKLSGDMVDICADIKSDSVSLLDLKKELEIRTQTAEKYKAEKNLTERTKADTSDRSGKFKELDERLLKENSELSLLEREAMDIDKVLNEISLKEDELSKLKSRYHILEAALLGLKAAEGNLKEKYITPVHASFGKYAVILEKSLGLKVKLTKELELKVEEGGVARRAEHLSTGQLSALSLALRLAIADNIYDDAFIILDDPFVNLDEEHLDKVRGLLKDLAKERQIIYLTCHLSRSI